MTSPSIPKRSSLFSLPTIRGESLTSYVLRLAARHRSPVRALVSYLRAGRPCRTSATSWLHGLSGAGLAAREGAVLIAKATRQDPLHRMTLLLIDALVRDSWDHESKWCPQCIKEQQETATEHIPLTWSLKGLDICFRHRVRLSRGCSCGEANSPRLTVSACPRCESSLALVVAPGTEVTGRELEIAQKIEEFVDWTMAGEDHCHPNHFVALQDLIDLLATRPFRSADIQASECAGRGVFARPRLVDAAEVAAIKSTSIASLFVVDETKQISWSKPVVPRRGTFQIDWSPIVEAAQHAASVGQPVMIEVLHQRFNVSPFTLRMTLTRKGIPWQRVRPKMSLDEARVLEARRERLVKEEARRWLSEGHAKSFKTFYAKRTPAMGSWAWRHRYRARYRQLFLEELSERPIVAAGKRGRGIDWQPIEAAAQTIDLNGRRPTALELADRFGLQPSAVRNHFRQKQLQLAPSTFDFGFTPTQKAQLEEQRERRIRILSELWLAEGNPKAFAPMTRALSGPDFEWINRSGHRPRYTKIFHEIVAERLKQSPQTPTLAI